jgi:hypothetical protein
MTCDSKSEPHLIRGLLLGKDTICLSNYKHSLFLFLAVIDMNAKYRSLFGALRSSSELFGALRSSSELFGASIDMCIYVNRGAENMNNKNRKFTVAAVAAFSLWASPAMAQDGFGGDDNRGFGGAPTDYGFLREHQFCLEAGSCVNPFPLPPIPRHMPSREERLRLNSIIWSQCQTAAKFGGTLAGGAAAIAIAAAAPPTAGNVNIAVASLVTDAVVSTIIEEGGVQACFTSFAWPV